MRATVNGRTVDRAAILAWEDRRMAAVRRRLGLARSTAPRAEQRRELLERKLALGHGALLAMLRRDLWLSERVTRLTVALSGPARRFSRCEIALPEGSAEHFAHWFQSRNDRDDEAAMIAACPDHYIIARDSQGRQRVVETTGGAPLAGDFTVDYADVSSLLTTPDPAYPHQVAGVARLDDGLAIGGVRHQFRQEGRGFRALLTVEFPRRVPGHMVAAHEWHLAVEFANWIEASQAA